VIQHLFVSGHFKARHPSEFSFMEEFKTKPIIGYFKVVDFDHFKSLEFEGFKQQSNCGETATISHLVL